MALTVGQKAETARATEALAQFDQSEMPFLRALLEREEWRPEEIRAELVGNHKFTDEMVARCAQKSVTNILIEVAKPTPFKSYSAYKINPVYRPILLDLVHGGK